MLPLLSLYILHSFLSLSFYSFFPSPSSRVFYITVTHYSPFFILCTCWNSCIAFYYYLLFELFFEMFFFLSMLSSPIPLHFLSFPSSPLFIPFSIVIVTSLCFPHPFLVIFYPFLALPSLFHSPLSQLPLCAFLAHSSSFSIHSFLSPLYSIVTVTSFCSLLFPCCHHLLVLFPLPVIWFSVFVFFALLEDSVTLPLFLIFSLCTCENSYIALCCYFPTLICVAEWSYVFFFILLFHCPYNLISFALLALSSLFFCHHCYIFQFLTFS